MPKIVKNPVHKQKLQLLTTADDLASDFVNVSGDTMTGQLDAEAGVLIDNTLELDSSDVEYPWGNTEMLGSAQLVSNYDVKQDDNWYYFGGTGGFLRRISKLDDTIKESTPIRSVTGALMTVARMEISRDRKYMFCACNLGFVKVDLGSFSQVAIYPFSTQQSDACTVALDETHVYFASTSLALLKFEIERFVLVKKGAVAGSTSVRGGTVDGTNLYVINSASPSTIYKYDLTDATLATVTTLSLTGNNTAYNCVIYGGYMYVVHRLSPSRISKVDLSTFTLTATKTLTSQNSAQGICTDGTYLYTSHYLNPVRISRVLISDFTTTSTLTNAGSRDSRSILYDSVSGNLIATKNNSGYSIIPTSLASYTNGYIAGSQPSIYAGGNGKYFGTLASQPESYFIDINKKKMTFIKLALNVGCYAYDYERSLVYAIDTHATSASIMILDLLTGKYVRTLALGLAHTSAITSAVYMYGGVLILSNSTTGYMASIDIATETIIAQVTDATNFTLISSMVSNQFTTLVFYGVKSNRKVFSISYDLTGYTEYGTLSLTDLAELPISLSTDGRYVIITGQTDKRVVVWDNTQALATATYYTITTYYNAISRLGGSVHTTSGVDDMVIVFHNNENAISCSTVNLTSGVVTFVPSIYGTGASKPFMRGIMLEVINGTEYINLFTTESYAVQVVINPITKKSNTNRALVENNSTTADATRVDTNSFNAYGINTVPTIIQGLEVIIQGVLKPLAGIVADGISTTSAYAKYLLTEYLKVEDRLQVGRSSTTYGQYLDVSSTGILGRDNDAVIRQYQSHGAVVMLDDEVVGNNDEVVTL